MCTSNVDYGPELGFLSTYRRVVERLDPADRIPRRIRLLENPASPVALPGAVRLDLHDGLHLLLNRGYDTADEAFVVGFSMGNDPRCRRRHERVMEVASRWVYPRAYRHSASDLEQFRAGVSLGRQVRPLLHLRPEELLAFGSTLGEIRVALGLDARTGGAVAPARRKPLCLS
jgi:hypothetical protein